MTLLLRMLLWTVSGVIVSFTSTGIGLEWISKRLVPIQRALSKKIEARE